MNKYFWCYAVWMAITTGIYAFIYLSTPLGELGIMWMTFVALPIFFTAGAQTNEIPNYICSMFAGIAWGIVDLWFINFLSDIGLSIPVYNALNLLIFTTLCVGLHLTVLSKTWFNKVPMVFGGLAVTFSQNAQNIVGIVITLLCGILLAATYRAGGNYLERKMIGK